MRPKSHKSCDGRAARRLEMEVVFWYFVLAGENFTADIVAVKERGNQKWTFWDGKLMITGVSYLCLQSKSLNLWLRTRGNVTNCISQTTCHHSSLIQAWYIFISFCLNGVGTTENKKRTRLCSWRNRFLRPCNNKHQLVLKTLIILLTDFSAQL